MFEERLYFWGLKNKFEKQFEQKLEFSESLKKYRIAALRDSNVASYLLDNDYNYTYLLTNADQNLKMVFFDRADLIIATELTVKTRAKQLGLDFNLLTNSEELTPLNNSLSIALSKSTDDKMVIQYQLAFQAIIGQGILSDLQQKWQILNAK